MTNQTVTAGRVGFLAAAGIALTVTVVVAQSLTKVPAQEITSVGPPGMTLTVGGVGTVVGLLAMGAALSRIAQGGQR